MDIAALKPFYRACLLLVDSSLVNDFAMAK
jgi:hypothetical protein